MLKQRWDNFMCPNGIRRTFKPKSWEHGTPMLVSGELLAFLGAIVAIALPNWNHGRWFLGFAAAIGTGALFWYALDKSSLGEMPLTGTSARRILAVLSLKETQEKLGPLFDWDTITGDGSQIMADLTKMKPEIKRKVYEENLRQKLQKAEPQIPQQTIDQVVDQIVGALPESESLEIADELLGGGRPTPFTQGDSGRSDP